MKDSSGKSWVEVSPPGFPSAQLAWWVEGQDLQPPRPESERADRKTSGFLQSRLTLAVFQRKAFDLKKWQPVVYSESVRGNSKIE